MPLMKSMTAGCKIQSDNRVIQEYTVLKIIAPRASTLVQNALKSLAAGALPQTPLGELTYTYRMKSMTTG